MWNHTWKKHLTALPLSVSCCHFLLILQVKESLFGYSMC